MVVSVRGASLDPLEAAPTPEPLGERCRHRGSGPVSSAALVAALRDAIAAVASQVASRSILHALEESFPGRRVYAQPSFRPPVQDQGWPRFLLVRSPLARAASCYRNKCRDAMEALERNGGLEPCQRHLLREAGAWPCRPLTGARRLAELDFAEFVELLPGVRDGNSHFRLQIDALRDAGSITSGIPWARRASRTLVHLGRTHYLTPRRLNTRPPVAADPASLPGRRKQSVRCLRPAVLPGAGGEGAGERDKASVHLTG